MPAFQFRLDRVLEWYRTQLQLEESRLAACLAALHLAGQRAARLQTERLSVEREVISRVSIAAGDLASLGLYRLRAKKEAAQLEEECARREGAVREQRSLVQAAQRRVRLVEKLRDRRWMEHRYAEDRALEGLAAEAYLSKWTAANKRTAAAPAAR